jgi:hypothetical protein
VRVVLDNCVPRTLIRPLNWPGTITVADLGWANLDDGPLLDRLHGACDVFITVDQNLAYQQRLDNRPFATIVLRGRSSRLPDLLPFLDSLRSTIAAARPGVVVEIGR